jgi:hypothetical protein
MATWWLLRSAPHPGRPMRVLLMALAVVSVMGSGAPPDAHGARLGPAHRGSSALVPPGHRCPHCPAAECATALPCASAGTGQLAASAVHELAGPPVRSLPAAGSDRHADSVADAPPTPPPQAAA